MPRCPLRRTCARPSDGADQDQKQDQKPGGLPAGLSFESAPADPAPGKNPNVGAGLLAKASCQSISMLPDPPLSRASPLPQGECVRLKRQAGR
ncbi:hypothetical protein PFAS1_27460 [Pseudomonas frederiksbergensis]|nr:hypothetical protein PFAS1_27460 [Pseudomonas frederiksbergensis]